MLEVLLVSLLTERCCRLALEFAFLRAEVLSAECCTVTSPSSERSPAAVACQNQLSWWPAAPLIVPPCQRSCRDSIWGTWRRITDVERAFVDGAKYGRFLDTNFLRRLDAREPRSCFSVREQLVE